MVDDRTNTRIGDEWVSYSIDLHRYAELHAFLQLQTHDAHDDGSIEVAPGHAEFGYRPVYFFGRQRNDSKVWSSAQFITFG